MPYSTDPETYPGSYPIAFAIAREHGSFKIDQPKGAANLRLKLYGFKRALKEAKDPRYALYRRLRISLDSFKAPKAVILSMPDADPSDPVARAIAEGGHSPPVEPPTREAQLEALLSEGKVSDHEYNLINALFAISPEMTLEAALHDIQDAQP